MQGGHDYRCPGSARGDLSIGLGLRLGVGGRVGSKVRCRFSVVRRDDTRVRARVFDGKWCIHEGIDRPTETRATNKHWARVES